MYHLLSIFNCCDNSSIRYVTASETRERLVTLAREEADQIKRDELTEDGLDSQDLSAWSVDDEKWESVTQDGLPLLFYASDEAVTIGFYIVDDRHRDIWQPDLLAHWPRES